MIRHEKHWQSAEDNELKTLNKRINSLKIGLTSLAITTGLFVSHSTLEQVQAEDFVETTTQSELAVETTMEDSQPAASAEYDNIPLSQVEGDNNQVAFAEESTLLEDTPNLTAELEAGVVISEEDSLTDSEDRDESIEVEDGEFTPAPTLTEESESESTDDSAAESKSPSTEQESMVQVDTFAETASTAFPEIEEGYFRLHFNQLPDRDPSEMGLWLWGDVANPSEQVGAWPQGATNLSQAKTSDYGYYLDVLLNEDPQVINYLINTLSGENLTSDQSINLVSQAMNQVWLDEEFNQSLYEELEDEGIIRVNYERPDNNYDGWGLWVWGDVEAPSESIAGWPDGAIDFINEGPFGRFIDLPISNGLDSSIQFLLVNKLTGEQSSDMSFADRENDSQIFLRAGDNEVYTSPYTAGEERINDAERTTTDTIVVSLSSVESLVGQNLADLFVLKDNQGNFIELNDIVIDEESRTVRLQGDFAADLTAYTLAYGDNEVNVRSSWRLMDELYAYDGELGSQLHEDGSVEMNLWAPTAESIRVVLYDKDNQDTIIGTYAMENNGQGVWNTVLDASQTAIEDHSGYYYHYEITRNGETVLALDPYAKSLAAWNNLADGARVAKAAIVNPSTIGPDLDFANIPGYEKREDAIIYEVHVRDFTSDPSIADELTSQFGTFSAFVERLDYLQDLGVTHIQLLPVMSYYYANEFENDVRELEWSASENRYNWGYDPQSYFSLSGMYSENPEDPAKRIEEFKNLVNEIHKRDMGVILDVVFNHTARTFLFEDLEPNYYHFMDKDGTARESFGGGRLGTTHHMSRRVLVDSIKYWVDEFKVDGFRFDMMGDHDAEAIQMAYDEAAKLNPNVLMLGEGWITFAGDEGDPVQPADQSWMSETEGVAVFSDEIRNMLKSGFGSEGQPKFLTGGSQWIESIFNNILGRPSNINQDDPGDIIQYIAAHDNLTLHDVIAQSIKKDPKYFAQEIHQRIRLGNLMILTSQGTPFIHAGQEFGRTKQFLHEDYKTTVQEAPYKTTYLVDENGNPFEYPYFVHDSYDSTDAINKIDWQKALNSELYPINTQTQEYTKGLIHLRRAVDGFRWGTEEEVSENVKFIASPEIGEMDLAIAYEVTDSEGNRYAVFINTDSQQREFTFPEGFEYIGTGQVIVDAIQAGTEVIENPEGLVLEEGRLILDPLTATIIRYIDQDDSGEEDGGENPGGPETPEEPGEPEEPENPGDSENPETPEEPEDPNGSGDTDEQGDSEGSESTEDAETPEDSEEPGEADSFEETASSDNISVDKSGMTVLPNTGESTDTRIFTAASLAVLSGLGLLATTKRKEDEEA